MSIQRKNSVLDTLKNLFAISLLLLITWAHANEASAQGPGNNWTQVGDGVDDGTFHIPLGHSFPYYDGVFTNAWMSSNGFIILYDATAGVGNANTGQSWCRTCGWGYGGGNPSGKSNLSYMVAPLWTDLEDRTTGSDRGYFYQTDTGGTSFLWWNVFEYGTNNENTFQLDLWPEGSLDFKYFDVDVRNHNTWIGFTGDATAQNGNIYSEVNEVFYRTKQQDIDMDDVASFASESINGGYAWWGQDGGYSSGPDCSNPLNDPSCDGYAEAYFAQQCSQNPLYDQQCSGYAEAYFNQQCSLDALYNEECPGYDDAYFDQQCMFDPQYDSQCAGYVDPSIFEPEVETDFGYDDDDMGSDDGSDDGSDYNEFGIEEEEIFYFEPEAEEVFFTEEVEYTSLEDLDEDIEQIVMEEIFEDDIVEDMFSDELVSDDGDVNEAQILEDSMTDIEEEIFEEELMILEELDIVEVLEDEVLEEEVELDTVELVTVTEKVTARPKVDAKSLVLEQTSKLVSEIQSQSEQSGSNSGAKSTNSANFVANQTQNNEKTAKSGGSTGNEATILQNNNNFESEVAENGDWVSPEEILFGSDNNLFTAMTGNLSNATESVSNATEGVSETENVEQNFTLGDNAPLGFAIIPVQGTGGVMMDVVPVESLTLADRLAEQVRQRNRENSNSAAVGQTAQLQKIASGVDMTSYYDTVTTYNQDVYTQSQVYGSVMMKDNANQYKFISDSHGTMRQLIRSQY